MRPAMASKWTTALVDPPMAASATIALWNEAFVRKVLGRRSAAVISTASRPVPWAASSNRLSGAGVPATPGTTVPSASATSAMVDAVPIVLQCPRLRIIADSERVNCSCDIVPARTSSDSRQTSVPQPSVTPRKVPVSIGPPGMTTAGRSTEAAAISSDGIVLSHPPSSTTPSIGLARSTPPWPSPPCCATASPSAGGAFLPATPPAAPAEFRRPRRSRSSPTGLPRSGGRYKGQVRGGVRDCDLRAAGEGARW